MAPGPDAEEAAAKAGGGRPLRVFFIPFFVPSHIVPMMGLARLFAARPGVEPTMVVTPANAELIRPTLARSAAAGRLVGVLTYPFPDVGLPPGVESLASAPPSEAWRILHAVDLSQPAHGDLLRHHRPDAVIADGFFWWTTDIAAELGIPRITCSPISVFSQLVLRNLVLHFRSGQGPATASGDEIISVPNLPGPPIRMPLREMPEFLRRPTNHVAVNWDRIKAAQMASHGDVVYTYYDLEPAYCDMYRAVAVRRAYFVGPVTLYHDDADGQSQRDDGRGTDEESRCLQWLDARAPASVLFVCFGSFSRISTAQLRELAAGLEASGRPFIWAVRKPEDEKGAEWLPAGWEERVAGRGVVVRGWAPQRAILGHAAVGAFLTHCGWSSTLETVAAGVPVLSWPLMFDQFITERLLVDVLGLGSRVVTEGERLRRSTIVEERELVPAAVIAKAVAGFWMPGGAGQRTRAKAREYAAAARAAMAEGGSSYRDLNRLIDGIFEARADRKTGGDRSV